MSKLNIFTDGGSRGNPGPAACAYVIQDDQGEILYQDSKFLGHTTNNVAEYQGLTSALNYLLAHKDVYSQFSPFAFHLDSELVVKQINGQYKVKDPNMLALYKNIMKILEELSHPFEFIHVPRSSNKIADKILNLELDKQKLKI